MVYKNGKLNQKQSTILGQLRKEFTIGFDFKITAQLNPRINYLC